MLLLLAGSAFFSGSETAFFNLSRRQIKLLEKSKHKLQNLVATLVNQPKQLLGCLLFGNMAINVLFFAIASVFTIRVERQIGTGAAVFTAFISFVLLILFGEILPKTLAYANSRYLSITTALPAFLFLKLFKPVVFFFRFLIVEPVLRLFLGPVRAAKPITQGEFKLLIEQVRKRGLITTDENKLLTEIIDLGFLKVRHVMQPRVDMVLCDIEDSTELARKEMLQNRLTKIPVYAGSVDNIIGLVYLRQLILQPNVPLEKLIQQVHFVPEQKTVESLLEFFQTKQIDTAVVVDEYGGIAGLVRLEYIAGELIGPMEIEEEIEPIEKIGPFQYRLSGNLPIHDWADEFGINTAEIKFSTIAGLVTQLLGKIPKAGDVVHLKNIKLTIERVQKHRIETVLLTFEPISNDDN